MFFPKLRRQAKWVFVFLALTFGVGFVAFGVGSGGTGIGDIFQGGGQSSSSGPSVKDARKKIEKGDPAGYKELADAYTADNEPDQAISALEQYVRLRPRDFDAIQTLAGDYEGKASKLRDQGTAIQAELQATTSGGLFDIPTQTQLGKAIGMGRVDREVTALANSKLSEAYGGFQSAMSRAAQLYQVIATAQPDDALLQLTLADAAFQARMSPLAVQAYQRFLKLAPDDPAASYARQQIALARSGALNQVSR
jgi:tetratricopeptide (TPR) repeat protein